MQARGREHQCAPVRCSAYSVHPIRAPEPHVHTLCQVFSSYARPLPHCLAVHTPGHHLRASGTPSAVWPPMTPGSAPWPGRDTVASLRRRASEWARRRCRCGIVEAWAGTTGIAEGGVALDMARRQSGGTRAQGAGARPCPSSTMAILLLPITAGRASCSSCAPALPPACPPACPHSFWMVNGRIAGYWKKYGTLEQLVLRNTGHMVPHDNPLVSDGGDARGEGAGMGEGQGGNGIWNRLGLRAVRLAVPPMRGRCACCSL